MKIKVKKRLLSLVAVIAIGLSCHIAQAQGIPGLGGDDKDVDDQGKNVPIDGFIGVAIAAGAYFGGKKLRDNKKEE